MSKEQKIIWSRRGMLIAALIGLFAAWYLLYTYTTGAELKCGPLLHGCDLVRASRWASLFGIPTPAFGVFFYLAVIFILFVRCYKPNYQVGIMRLTQIVFAVAGFVESFVLTLIQRFIIQSFCSWCLVSAAAASSIFIFIWFDRALELEKEQALKELKIFFYTMTGAVIISLVSFAILIRPGTPEPLFTELAPALPDSFLIPTEPAPETVITASTEDQIIIALGPKTPIDGPIDSKVTIVEFLDYQCPSCGMYHNLVIKPIREKYQGRIRYAIRHYPLPDLHPSAMGAAIAAVCADVQGKFFPMSDLLLENQTALGARDLAGHANELGLDVKAFTDCLGNPDARKQVLSDRDAGHDLGVTGTPTIIINNALVEGTPNFETLSKLIDAGL